MIMLSRLKMKTNLNNYLIVIKNLVTKSQNQLRFTL